MDDATKPQLNKLKTIITVHQPNNMKPDDSIQLIDQSVDHNNVGVLEQGETSKSASSDAAISVKIIVSVKTCTRSVHPTNNESTRGKGRFKHSG